MKYPLDFESTFEKSLLFWLTRFVRNKTTSLSNSNITDQTQMAILIKSLINDIRSINDLTKKGLINTPDANHVAMNIKNKSNNSTQNNKQRLQQTIKH